MPLLKRITAVFLMLAFLIAQTVPAYAQPRRLRLKVPADRPDPTQVTVSNQTNFDSAKLTAKWGHYISDKGFKALVEKAKAEGFKRITNNDKFAWGFEGTIKRAGSTRAMNAEVCAFDFIKNDGSQMASIVFRNVGDEVYKALVIFPADAKDIDATFLNAVEWYADQSGTIQRAHSFNTCFNNCIKNTSPLCLGVMAGCSASATLIGFTGAGLPFALGLLGACAGFACVLPLAVCAVRC